MMHFKASTLLLIVAIVLFVAASAIFALAPADAELASQATEGSASFLIDFGLVLLVVGLIMRLRKR